ncbi:amidohydrolase family protein, partial [Aduncisulcus paluster]
VKSKGLSHPKHHCGCHPAIGEELAIHAFGTIAQHTDCDGHIVHISTDRGSTIAHEYGCTWEVCLHHLLLDESRSSGEDDFIRSACHSMSPPLRPLSDALHLKGILCNPSDPRGKDVFVVTDHCPFTHPQRFGKATRAKRLSRAYSTIISSSSRCHLGDESSHTDSSHTDSDTGVVWSADTDHPPFYTMPGGVGGIQYRFIGIYSFLHLNPARFVDVVSSNAAKRYGL